MARSAAKTMAMRVQVIGSAPGTAIAGEPPPVDQHVLARALDGRLLVIELRLDGAVVGGLHGEQAAAEFGREQHRLGGGIDRAGLSLAGLDRRGDARSEEHTSELQSLM